MKNSTYYMSYTHSSDSLQEIKSDSGVATIALIVDNARSFWFAESEKGAFQVIGNNNFNETTIMNPPSNEIQPTRPWLEPKDIFGGLIGLVGVVLGVILVAFRERIKSIKAQFEEVRNLNYGLTSYQKGARDISDSWEKLGLDIESNLDIVSNPRIPMNPNYNQYFLKEINKPLLANSLINERLLSDVEKAFGWVNKTANIIEGYDFYHDQLASFLPSYQNNFGNLISETNNLIYKLPWLVEEYNRTIKEQISNQLIPASQIEIPTIQKGDLDKIKSSSEENGIEIKSFHVDQILSILEKIKSVLEKNRYCWQLDIQRTLWDQILKSENLIFQCKSETKALAYHLKSKARQLSRDIDLVEKKIEEAPKINDFAKKATPSNFRLIIKVVKRFLGIA